MATPLYYKIYRDLQYKICSGEYISGMKLPREQDLEKIYGTSRAPVRQALGALENEGLIIRCPGRGTFVTDRPRTFPWLLASGLSKCYATNWDHLTHQTVMVTQAPAPRDVADFLGVSTGREVIHMVRCQSVSELPTVLMHVYVTTAFDIEMIKRAGHFMSWKELLRSSFNTTISAVMERLAIEVVSAFDASYLKVEPGTWCMRLSRFGFDGTEKPLFASINYIRPGNWEYETRFQQSDVPNFREM